MMLVKTDLATEVTRLLEAGVTRHLNSSIFYSPLRYFYNKFKKNNPQTVDSARNIIRQDIAGILSQIPNFRTELFVREGEATENGKLFLTRVYNIGIKLLKKHLTIRQAFSVMTNSSMRMRVYNFILKSVEKAAVDFMSYSTKVGSSR